MSLPRFVLVTGNADKLAEARRLWPGELEHAAIDLPEIQSLDLAEVLQAKADEAWRRLQRPLVVEETGFELAALSGFPGPLVKWMLEAVGATGIARTPDARRARYWAAAGAGAAAAMSSSMPRKTRPRTRSLTGRVKKPLCPLMTSFEARTTQSGSA